METRPDFKFFSDDELSLSTEEGMGGRYVMLTVWSEGEDGKLYNGDEFAFTPAEAREFADNLRRYADKAEGVELP